jgi:hypothetical protein
MFALQKRDEGSFPSLSLLNEDHMGLTNNHQSAIGDGDTGSQIGTHHHLICLHANKFQQEFS